MARLDTTTWENRNYHRIKRVKEEAVKLRMQNPSIIDIGPGGLVNFLFNYFPTGKKEDWTIKEKLSRGILRLIEDLLRKTDLFDLETSEPREIAYMFKDLQPEVLYVVDSEPKVIEAVRKMVHRNGLPINLDYTLVNTALQQIPHKGDVVIAYFVIERSGNYQKSLETIADSVNKGGLLSITGVNGCIPGFTMKDKDLYLRTH